MSQCTYFENIEPTVVLKCRALVFFFQVHFMIFVLKPNQNKGKITLIIFLCGYELTFWFISIENGGKQKSKTTLRVR